MLYSANDYGEYMLCDDVLYSRVSDQYIDGTPNLQGTIETDLVGYSFNDNDARGVAYYDPAQYYVMTHSKYSIAYKYGVCNFTWTIDRPGVIRAARNHTDVGLYLNGTLIGYVGGYVDYHMKPYEVSTGDVIQASVDDAAYCVSLYFLPHDFDASNPGDIFDAPAI